MRPRAIIGGNVHDLVNALIDLDNAESVHRHAIGNAHVNGNVSAIVIVRLDIESAPEAENVNAPSQITTAMIVAPVVLLVHENLQKQLQKLLVMHHQNAAIMRNVIVHQIGIVIVTESESENVTEIGIGKETAIDVRNIARDTKQKVKHLVI